MTVVEMTVVVVFVIDTCQNYDGVLLCHVDVILL